MHLLPLHFPLRRLDRDAPTKQFLAPEIARPEWHRGCYYYVYRFYDVDQRPLYFGITSGSAIRWDQHRKRAPWWTLAEYVAVSFYRSYEAIQEAERAALRNEQPRCNKTLTRGPANASIPLHQPAEIAAAHLFREAMPDFLAELAVLLGQPERFPQPKPPPLARFADGEVA